MLTTDAPFPQVGSYALHRDDYKTRLARIQQRQGDTALISFPCEPGASGTRTVPLAELEDATPLTSAERAELKDLGNQVRATRKRTREVKIAEARCLALRRRDINAATLDNLRMAAGLPPLAKAA